MTNVGEIVLYFFAYLDACWQVLHRRLSEFHTSLKLAGSLDETISLHESQSVPFEAVHRN